MFNRFWESKNVAAKRTRRSHSPRNSSKLAPCRLRMESLEPRMMLSVTPADKILYNVATAHLDTQWNWTIQDTIDSYLPNTLNGNFALFQNPNNADYKFSFEGAYRYMLAKEYYPALYDQLKNYVASGQWNVAGSAIDAGDVNISSPEALMRQFLYGNEYFKQEFGKTSTDVFLPDCFGFGYALPSVASHMGLQGFSTQKLSWGSAYGIPFNVGVWQGPDGASIMAALNPGSYGSDVPNNLDYDTGWQSALDSLGDATTIANPYDMGAYYGYRYFGVGDTGGSPSQANVTNLETDINNTDAARLFSSTSASSDQMFRDLYANLTPAQIALMPRYNGELVMTTHGTGSYTSQAEMKKWNRENELLGTSAEQASVMADWLGGAAYPMSELTQAWTRFLEHQFHDDITGTSIPDAYDFSWNDELLSLNQFASVLTNGVGATAQALNTQTVGEPLVVYNPLSAARQDIVEATVQFPAGTNPASVRVYDSNGSEVASQVESISGDSVKFQILANVPSAGFQVYDVRPSATGYSTATGLSIALVGTDYVLTSNRYIVKVNATSTSRPLGDVWSIVDKSNGNRELLSAPVRLQLLPDNSTNWPAWEVLYSDITAAPSYVDGTPTFRIVENGKAEVSLEVTRVTNGSTFVQTISLTPNGDQVGFNTKVDWETPGKILKAVFPLAVSNSKATYDLGLGTIQRGNDTSNLYEVPAQQWADITNTMGTYGVSIINDCKYGWDKPSNNTLRLTLLATPTGTYNDQNTLDFGQHEMNYGIVGHGSTWSPTAGNTPDEAARLNQPLMAFQTAKHAGVLGGSYSFASVNTAKVAIRALKLAETPNPDGSRNVIVRLQELSGTSADNVLLSLGNGIASAREVNGSEQDIGPATINSSGQLVVNMTAYQPRTFSLVLKAPTTTVSAPTSQPVALPFDSDPNGIDVVSKDSNPGDFSPGGMGGGFAISGDLLPSSITVDGIVFQMGSTIDGFNNALACNGQTISLSPGTANKLYILAAATGGQTVGAFTINTSNGPQTVNLAIADFAADVGRWGRTDRYDGTGYIERDEVAWIGTHRHSATSAGIGPDNAYMYTNLFKYEIDLPAGATSITLPANLNIRLMAMTLSNNHNDDTHPASDLYDAIPYLPKAVNDTFYVAGSIPTTLDVLANDQIPNPPAHIVSFTQPTSGASLALNADNTFRYAYPAGRTAPDTFTYTMQALNGLSYTATVTIIADLPSSIPPSIGPGLQYSYYQGSWSAIPNWSTLTPVAQGTVTNFDLSPRAQNDNIGFQYTGYIKVPVDGAYTFYTRSDDGSALYIDNNLVVNNDGLHSSQERSGAIGLMAGFHAISVGFIQGGGDLSLSVSYSGMGIMKQAIPDSALYYVGPNLAPQITIKSPAIGGVSLTDVASLLSLEAVVTDDGRTAGPVTQTWSVVQKPLGGNVTFGDVSAASTTAQFSAVGTYVLKLTATDGSLTSSKSVAVVIGLGGRGPTPDLGWWKFDENAGTSAHDAAGTDNVGTLSAGTSWTTGVNGSAIQIGSDAAYVQVNNEASLNPTTAITLSAWVNVNTWDVPGVNNNGRILQKGSGDNQYRLLKEGGVLKFDLTSVGTITAPLPSTGAWHLITATYARNDKMRLYVDGVQVAESATTFSTTIATTADPLFIGNKSSSVSGGFRDSIDGKIDDVRIYGRALTAAEVAMLSALLNWGPQVGAGADKNVLGSTTSLLGTVSDDGRPAPPATVTYRWYQTSGPGTATFTAPTSIKTDVTVNQYGSYKFRLVANDSQVKTADEIVVQFAPPDSPPTDIAISNASVTENQPAATSVGTLSTTDPDAGDTFTYSLVAGSGGDDNASFAIVGNVLKTAASFDYESKNSYSIRIRTTDQGGLYFEKIFSITVTNVPETLYAGPVEWTAAGTAGLTLKLDAGGMLHLYQTSTTTNIVPPHLFSDITNVSVVGIDGIDDRLTIDFTFGNPIPTGGASFDGGTLGGGNGNSLIVAGSSSADSVRMTASEITVNGSAPISYTNIAFFGFDLGGGGDNLFIVSASLILNRDDVISAGTKVTVDGGTLDFNGHSDSLGDLVLKNNGQVKANAILNNATTVVSGALTADTIVCDTLIIGTSLGTSSGSIAVNVSSYSLPLAPQTLTPTIANLSEESAKSPVLTERLSVTAQPLFGRNGEGVLVAANSAVSIPLAIVLSPVADSVSAPITASAEPIVNKPLSPISSPSLISVVAILEPSVTPSSIPEKIIVSALSPEYLPISRTVTPQPSLFADRLKVSLYQALIDILSNAKKPSNPAFAGDEAHRFAVQSLIQEFEHGGSINPEDSELLAGMHFRKQDKLTNKVFDEFHTDLDEISAFS